MGVRKQSEKNIRKLTKVGGKTLVVSLPIEVIRELGWKEKQKLIVKRIHGGVTIRDWRNSSKSKK